VRSFYQQRNPCDQQEQSEAPVRRYHSAGELPADFLSGLWLAKANNYRLLCEPVDIANYYRPWATDR